MNTLDPDQTGQNVRPDLGPNCFLWLSVDDNSRQRVMICFQLVLNHVEWACSKDNIVNAYVWPLNKHA